MELEQKQTRELKERLHKLLFYIIDEYIKTAIPVGSKTIILKYMPNYSAATIRNDMLALEKMGFLEKQHVSSGRIPSIKAYKYYESRNNKLILDKDIEFKLREIFAKRTYSIDDVINKTIAIINSFLKLPSIVTQKNASELLKRIDLIKTTQTSAIVILVTSLGNIFKSIINFQDENCIKDISICIRIFNDRLIDTPIDQLKDKANSLRNIIKEKVTQYEFIFQNFISQIFNIERKNQSTIHGYSELLSIPEFLNNKDKLEKVLKMLDDSTIWDQISYHQHLNGGMTSIIFGDQIGIDNLCIGSTEIDTGEGSTQISIVGPTRMDYKNVKGILDFVKKEIEKVSKAK